MDESARLGAGKMRLQPLTFVVARRRDSMERVELIRLRRQGAKQQQQSSSSRVESWSWSERRTEVERGGAKAEADGGGRAWTSRSRKEGSRLLLLTNPQLQSLPPSPRQIKRPAEKRHYCLAIRHGGHCSVSQHDCC